MKVRKNEGYLVVINGFQLIGWIARYETWHERADFENCRAIACDYRGAISALRSARKAGVYIGKGMPEEWTRNQRGHY